MQRAAMRAVRAAAPANLALVKYMGKVDASGNRPANPSLSCTLAHLRSVAEVSLSPTGRDKWALLDGVASANANALGHTAAPLRLSPAGERRVLAFARRVLDAWGRHESVLLRTTNDFPSDAGLASSASSFAAVTRALAAWAGVDQSAEVLADISRTGSGSSCRSFHVPWCRWDDDGTHTLHYPVDPVGHVAVVVDARAKAVSSTEAHRRVMTSPRFAGRPDRAADRLAALDAALRRADWARAYVIAGAEFDDMHKLFETSDPPFRYRTADSDAVVASCRDAWDREGDGPLVTMDAGANVHLLFRADQAHLQRRAAGELARCWRVLSSLPAAGAR